jgi:hypothetical protein
MSMATLSSVSNVLAKTAGTRADIALKTFPLWQLLKGKAGSGKLMKKSVGGKITYYWSRPMPTSTGDNARNIAETGTLAAYNPSTADEALYSLLNTVSLMQISNMALNAGVINSSVDDDDVKVQEDGMMKDWRVKMMNGFMGQHQGWITSVRGGEAVTGLVVPVCDTDLFLIGQYINFYSTAWSKNTGPGTSGTCLISAVHPESDADCVGPHIHLNATPGNGSSIANGSFIVFDGQYNLANYGLGDGIQAGNDITCGNYTVAKALTTYGNLSRSTYPDLVSLIYQPDGSGGVGAPTVARLFTWIAKIAAHQGEGKADISLCFGHSHTVTSIWEILAATRTLGLPSGGRIAYGADLEPTINHPSLIKPVKFEGHIGAKKYCLTALKLSDPEDFFVRDTGDPHYVNKGDNGIFSYDGYPNGGSHAWSATLDYIWGMIINSRAHSMYAGIQLPTEEQVG